MSNQIQTRITALRELMQAQNLDGYLIPRTDEFQNEFVAAYAERLKFISGFTGSAGWAVILGDKAALLTDARYTLQAAQQVDGDIFEVVDMADCTVGAWLKKNADDVAKIGFDPKLITIDQLKTLEGKAEGISFVSTEDNLIDHIWKDQPQIPQEQVDIFPDEIAGKTAPEKIASIQDGLKKEKIDAYVITAPDSICWLFNLRGNDVPYIPIILSYAIISSEGPVKFFVSINKISDEVQEKLGEHVQIIDFENLEAEIQNLAVNSQKIAMDFKGAPVWFKNIIGGDIVNMKDPCSQPRSLKTESEKASIRDVHIHDGLAVTKFLYWLEQQNPNDITELDVVEKLEEFRRKDPGYKGPSFPTIAGFGSNGAIIHYRPTSETNKKLEEGSLLLIDSGGQYSGGTTDITRTIAIGQPSEDMIRTNTLVLKGHIALAMAEFEAGTTGKEIDAIARKPLKDNDLNYAHGTGHGVGCQLAVHEAAANISPKGEDALEAGMLLSNEPGYYKEGAFGIRIENLVFVEEKGDQLGFETVTFAPLDLSLIDQNLLNDPEKEWLNEYHALVFEKLSPLISASKLKSWLRYQTRSL